MTRAKPMAQNGTAKDEMTLAVIVEEPIEWECLTAFDFSRAGISPIVFSILEGSDPKLALRQRLIPHRLHDGSSRLVLADFAEIVAGFEEEKPDACFLLGGGPFTRLTATAADLLGIPVFSLVTTEEQLANLGHREKHRPDLYFLTDSRLFPAALSDPRYGATLLPTGHPARDLYLQGTDTGDNPFDAPHLGDGQAAVYILAAIERWRSGTLAPPTPELSIIVPAYNEAENLPLVCDRLLKALEKEPIAAEILLVDDASPDETYAVAREQMWRSPRIRALTKPLPRGMGNAIREGLRRARAPVIAVTMGDGSDEVDRIPEMFRKVRDDGMSLAIGSRYRHRRNYRSVPRIYRFWSFCFRLTTRFFIGLKLKDYTNSFRVYHRDIFKRYGPESGGFEISPESTFKAWFSSRKVTEVDVCHLKRAAGQSSFSFFRAGPGYGKILFKAFVQRLTGKWFVLDW